MNITNAYTSAEIILVMEFKVFYPEIKDYPTIESLLESVPRESIVRIAQILRNNYKELGLDNVQKFFSPESSELKSDFNERANKFSTKGVTYMFSSSQTALELLRYAFSIEYVQSNLSVSEYEENLLKAILIINENRMRFEDKTNGLNIKKDSLLKLAMLHVVNSFSNKDIDAYDIHEVYREILTLSIDLLEHVSSDEFFKPIYEGFLESTGVNSYQEYLQSIIYVFSLAFKDGKLGTFEYDKQKDPENLIHQSVLEYISLPVEQNIGIIDNEDYKVFRSKPLIKIADGVYEIINLRFLLERMFTSLYFDFKKIAERLDIKSFENKYTEAFVEKVLLDKYLQKVNQNNHYVLSLTDEESKKLRGKNESGEPDYYFKSKDGNVVLFECKDIRINSKIKTSRSSEAIIKEYKNKLLLKAYNSNGPIKKPKPIGIGQLVDQMYKIQHQMAFWDKEVQRSAKVYPVLVISDSKLLPDGMPVLMEDWYQSNCRTKKINTRHVKPLIVLSISTLLLYAEEFSKKGLEYYFEKYYYYISISHNNPSPDLFLTYANLSISFPDYMNKMFPKNFESLFEEYHSKLLKKINNK